MSESKKYNISILFQIVYCDTNDKPVDKYDEFVAELHAIHPEFAAAAALRFFGLDYDFINVNDDFSIDWDCVKAVFEKYCTDYLVLTSSGTWTKAKKD